ncbi:MAG: glycosyltransferase family 4 protein [Clostridium sp.]
MNICIDGRAAKWYRGTGIGTYTHQLITYLNKINCEDQYLLFLPEDSSLENLNDNFHIEIVDTNPNNNFWDEIRVPNILNNNDIDLYHVPQNGVGLSPSINCPKVITLHDIIPLRMPETVSQRYLKIFNEDLPKIINDIDGIITVSEFSKLDISKEFNYPLDKIFVTHLAAEKIYKPLSKCQCKNIISNKYDIDDKFVLYVGGFSPRKNIIGLIEAFSLIPKEERLNTKLVIVGNKGISYPKYQKRTEDLGISNEVIFTGFIPLEDMPIFYNAAEVLVYPSYYEGFGLPPIEAMACGTPVIASNVTSLPEVCYDSALLVNPYNTEALSYTISRVLNDSFLMLTMVKKSLMRSNLFSWENTASLTLDAYRKIINNK